MELLCESQKRRYIFAPLDLRFSGDQYENIFSLKNNKSLRQTLFHPRYYKLEGQSLARYPNKLDAPLGMFLLDLKLNGDDFYKKFLNRYGDRRYSNFKLVNSVQKRLVGIYAYTVNESLSYIGRCRDDISKRIDQGYGTVHPKNCYIDGQATNCRLNALVTSQRDAIRLWFCPIVDILEISQVELALITAYRPAWNIQNNTETYSQAGQ